MLAAPCALCRRPQAKKWAQLFKITNAKDAQEYWRQIPYPQARWRRLCYKVRAPPLSGHPQNKRARGHWGAGHQVFRCTRAWPTTVRLR